VRIAIVQIIVCVIIDIVNLVVVYIQQAVLLDIKLKLV